MVFESKSAFNHPILDGFTAKINPKNALKHMAYLQQQ